MERDAARTFNDGSKNNSLNIQIDGIPAGRQNIVFSLNGISFKGAAFIRTFYQTFRFIQNNGKTIVGMEPFQVKA